MLKQSIDSRTNSLTGKADNTANRTDVGKHSGGAFAGTARPVGTAVLKPSLKVKNRHQELFNKKKKDEIFDELMAAAKNMAKCYKFKLKTKSLSCNADIKTMIEELREKSDEYIFLSRTDEGKVELRHALVLDQDYCTYYIPMGETFDMREETGLLCRRFIRAFDIAHNLGTIVDTMIYEMEKESYYDEIYYVETASKEVKEQCEAYKETNSFIADYWEGDMCRVFADYKALTPATRQEIKGFKPINKAEAQLKKLMLQGMDFIDKKINIWYYCELNDSKKREEVESEGTGIIETRDKIAVCYKEDALITYLLNQLNMMSQCGAYQESFMIDERIEKEGNIFINTDLKKFFEYIERFTFFIQKKDLKIKKEIKQNNKAA